MTEEKRIEVKPVCVDCNVGIAFKRGGLTILNGKLLKYEKPDGTFIFAYKCSDCYARNKELKNFQECEVYSRVCGYLRPVQQWNKAKKDEHFKKKTYKIKPTQIKK